MTTSPLPPPPGEGQVRTCVGCRVKAPRSALVRIVLIPHTPRAEVDERTDAPGRGAWLHADRACLDVAERRRAIHSAPRPAAPGDPADVPERLSPGVSLAQHE